MQEQYLIFTHNCRSLECKWSAPWTGITWALPGKMPAVHHFNGLSPKVLELLWHNRLWQLHRPCFRLLGSSSVEKVEWKWPSESLVAAAQALRPSWHFNGFSTVDLPTESTERRILCGLALREWYATRVKGSQPLHPMFDSKPWVRFLGACPANRHHPGMSWGQWFLGNYYSKLCLIYER